MLVARGAKEERQMALTPEEGLERELAAYRASEAKRRMKTGELVIEFSRDTNDPCWNESAYRTELEKVRASLNEAGIQWSETVIALEGLGTDTHPLGEFALEFVKANGPAICSAISAVLVAWIARNRQKVRVKFLDEEYEASSVKEVERLMNKVEIRREKGKNE